MPVFIFLVILGTVILWFLLSSIFIPVGKKVWDIIHDTQETMSKDEEDVYIMDENGNYVVSNNKKER